jgi:LysM repeat protein
MNRSAAFGKSSVHARQRNRHGACDTASSHRATGATSGRLEVIALIIIVVLLIFGALATRGTPVVSPSLSRLKVQAGDSLWILAAEHPVAGLTTAQLADFLAKTNRIEGGRILPGQTILVPAGSFDQRLAAR